jgi:prepilin-type N-terminal cleavage/methylation domain-containing protein
MPRTRPDAGFTLVEMLVATGIFLFGFSAAYALFLIGMHYRQQAEAMTKTSLAANALIDEFRLASGLEDNAPCQPSEYIGDGFARNGQTTTGSQNLYPYASIPGVWYCVRTCTDASGGNEELTTTLHLTLLVTTLDLPPSSSPIAISSLGRRLGATGEDTIITAMIERGLMVQFHTAVLRRASWLPRL